MTKTTVNNQVIFLNSFKEQTFENRPFRLSGSRQNLQQPQKYIDGMYLHHYYHSFIYLDQQGGMFEIECDYQNKYINNSFKKL